MRASTNTEQLYRVVGKIADGAVGDAERILRGLLGGLEVDKDRTGVKHLIFGGALAGRLGKSSVEEANLYLADFDVPQIHLFNLLGRHFHPVSLSTAVLNGAIEEASETDTPTVIDVGIGTGRQMEALIAQLAASKRPPRRMQIIGVEPSKWALDLAGENVKKAGSQHGIDVSFVPLHGTAEHLSLSDWRELRAMAKGAVVNAAFALHHIKDEPGRDMRAAVLGALRSLEPAALVLAEPDSDHEGKDLIRRFHNCWRHFGMVFRLVDELPIEQSDKDALKVCFFGREIKDILGQAEDARTERHGDVASWLVRLRRAGFEMVDFAPRPGTPTFPLVAARPREGFLSLEYQGETMVGLFCAVPTGEAPALESLGFGAVAERPKELRRDLDLDVYFAALAAIARVDGAIHDAERRFVEHKAAILGADVKTLWDSPRSLEETLANSGPLSVRTKEAVLRDSVLLAMVDGHYAEQERAQAATIARTLGLDPEVLHGIEIAFRSYVPEALERAPSWFSDYWLMGAN